MSPSRSANRNRRGRPPSLLHAMSLLSSLFAIPTASATPAAASSSTSSSASTGTSSPQTIRVEVGPSGATSYQPNNITANIGDVIQFYFYPTNHSVVRGEYFDSGACGPGAKCNPCVPWELIHPDKASKAFHSDNIKTQDFPSSSGYNLTVTDLDPIWFYCTAIDSCTPNGMVGVINGNSSQSIDSQVQYAKQFAKFALSPGQAWPAEGMPGASASTGAPSAGTSAPVTHDHKLSGGAIAGIAVGAAAVLLLAGALFYFVGRSKSYKDILKKQGTSEGQAPSQVGENVVGPWSPAVQQTPTVGSGWDHRFSQQTMYSAAPPQGQFMGYNRHTGAPEFANEVGTVMEKPHAPGTPPQGHPIFQRATTYELPGTQPEVAEAPAGTMK